jgi:hypothetical protein
MPDFGQSMNFAAQCRAAAPQYPLGPRGDHYPKRAENLERPLSSRLTRAGALPPPKSSNVMAKTQPPRGQDSTTWRVGQRVSRKDSNELGTIVEVDREVKVRWDGGRTSYFRRDVSSNVRLADTDNC